MKVVPIAITIPEYIVHLKVLAITWANDCVEFRHCPFDSVSTVSGANLFTLCPFNKSCHTIKADDWLKFFERNTIEVQDDEYPDIAHSPRYIEDRHSWILENMKREPTEIEAFFDRFYVWRLKTNLDYKDIAELTKGKLSEEDIMDLLKGYKKLTKRTASILTKVMLDSAR